MFFEQRSATRRRMDAYSVMRTGIVLGGLALVALCLPRPSTSAFQNTGLAASGHNFACPLCHAGDESEGDFGKTKHFPQVSDELMPSFSTAYESSTMDGEIVDLLAGPTLKCLSCHDGSMASDVTASAGGRGHFGVNHPIGFDYEQVAAVDRGIKPSSTFFDGGIQVADVLYKDEFGRSIMTCTTCHDVHNGPHVSDRFLLYGRLDGSSLCYTCHNK